MDGKVNESANVQRTIWLFPVERSTNGRTETRKDDFARLLTALRACCIDSVQDRIHEMVDLDLWQTWIGADLGCRGIHDV